MIFLAQGALPAAFAWPAVVGRHGHGPGRTLRRLAVGPGTRPPAGGGFNVFGLADLIDAATLGVLLGLGLFAVEPTTEILAFLPLTLLPTVAVPVALTLYIVSLRELRAGVRGKISVHDHPYRRADHWCPKGDHSGLACRPASDREHQLR